MRCLAFLLLFLLNGFHSFRVPSSGRGRSPINVRVLPSVGLRASPSSLSWNNGGATTRSSVFFTTRAASRMGASKAESEACAAAAEPVAEQDDTINFSRRSILAFVLTTVAIWLSDPVLSLIDTSVVGRR